MTNPHISTTPAMVEAVEHLAVAHEEAKKPLVAVDLRSGNLGKMGVAWVETKTALAAIRSALQSSIPVEEMIGAIERLALLAGDVNMNDPLSKWFTPGQFHEAAELLSRLNTQSGERVTAFRGPHDDWFDVEDGVAKPRGQQP